MIASKKLPDKEFLDYLFLYEKDSGELYRKVTTSSNAKSGDKVSNVSKKGYKRVRLNGTNFYAHRVIWKMFYGDDPPEIIDHINRNKLDNRIENLRKADPQLNQVNQGLQKNNRSGLKGVRFFRGKWEARIRIYKKDFSIGRFERYCDAAKARKNAEKLYF